MALQTQDDRVQCGSWLRRGCVCVAGRQAGRQAEHVAPKHRCGHKDQKSGEDVLQATPRAALNTEKCNREYHPACRMQPILYLNLHQDTGPQTERDMDTLSDHWCDGLIVCVEVCDEVCVEVCDEGLSCRTCCVMLCLWCIAAR